MTLTQFMAKWNGKYLEVAGSADALNQCVDLANAYIRDVLGLPIIEWTNAVDFPSKVGSSYDWIANTPTNIPQEGDIVVWKPSPGHIAVFISGNVDTFQSFDQNFPLNSPCHVQNHDYTNVTGWLRAKVTPVDIQPELNQCRLDRDAHWNFILSVANLLNVQANESIITAEIKKLVGYEDLVVKQDAQIQDLQAQLTAVKNDLAIKTQDDLKAQQDLNTAQGQIDELQKKYQESQLANTDLSARITELEKAIVAPVRKGWKAFLVSLVDKL